MMINFKIRGVEKVQEYLASLPYGVTKIALTALTEYVIGDETHGLKHPDPYKYASRAKAYGYTGAKFENGNPVPAGYFSAKQFRYVAAITKGFTMRGENRTGNSTDAWQYVEVSPYNIKIVNPEPGAYWTRDDSGQARQPANVGWRKVSAVIEANIKGAMKHATAEVNNYLKSKGKK